MTEKNYATALREVRNAYRLLYDFHEKVFPRLELLMEQFPVEYYFSEFSGCSRRTASNNPISAAFYPAMLPSLNMDVLYMHTGTSEKWSGKPKKNDYMLVLSLHPDASLLKEDKIHIDWKRYATASEEERKSLFLLTVLYCNTDSLEKLNWHGSVYYGEWRYIPGVVMPFTPDKAACNAADPQFLAYGCEVTFEDLEDENAIQIYAEKFKAEVQGKIPGIDFTASLTG